MNRRLAGVLLVGTVVFAARAADQPIAVKVHDPQAGDKIRVTEVVKDTSTNQFEAGGQKREKVEKKGRSVVYVEDVITAGKPGKKPDKAKRTYESFEVTKDGKTEKGPLDGKTVQIERKDDKFTFKYADGGSVETAVAADLDREFNGPGSLVKSADMLPDKPVKAGDTWELNKGKLLKELSEATRMEFDAGKATATGKLVKTYMKAGKQFGAIETKLTAPIKGLIGKGGVTVKDGAVLNLAITTDGCIDGSDPTATASGRVVVTVEAATMGVEVKVTIETEQTTKREPVTTK
jgi:hypothetical protein